MLQTRFPRSDARALHEALSLETYPRRTARLRGSLNAEPVQQVVGIYGRGIHASMP